MNYLLANEQGSYFGRFQVGPVTLVMEDGATTDPEGAVFWMTRAIDAYLFCDRQEVFDCISTIDPKGEMQFTIHPVPI